MPSRKGRIGGRDVAGVGGAISRKHQDSGFGVGIQGQETGRQYEVTLSGTVGHGKTRPNSFLDGTEGLGPGGRVAFPPHPQWLESLEQRGKTVKNERTVLVKSVHPVCCLEMLHMHTSQRKVWKGAPCMPVALPGAVAVPG